MMIPLAPRNKDNPRPAAQPLIGHGMLQPFLSPRPLEHHMCFDQVPEDTAFEANVGKHSVVIT